MKINHSSVQLGAAILAGFLGGALSNHVWVSTPAQAKAPQAQEITARNIRIVDDQGKLRMQVGMVNDKQSPAVIFLNPESGEPIGVFGIDEDQSGHLMFKGPLGQSSVDLKVTEGEASLSLSSAKDRAGLDLSVRNQGDVSMIAGNKDRNQEMRLEIDHDRTDIVVLQDGEKAGAGLITGPGVDPALVIIKDNMPRAILGSTDVLGKQPDKVPFHDKRGPDSLVFLTDKGQARWKAP